ncbi:PqqD family protein [Micromonospora chokoriensis]
MNAEAPTVYRVRGDRVAWRAARDETVLLDIRQSVYMALDRSGAMLWPHLMEGATAAELAEVLAERGPVELERATADVHAFLAELEAIDLIERL